ncbi:MAG: TolC family protein [Oligoflexia bacterium]|nr:TolC family protein [Oligoflexia bacterium]
MVRLLLLTFAPFAFSAVPQGGSLDFKETVRYALEHSLDYDNARRNFAIAEMEHRNSFYEFFPKLDFDSSHGVSFYESSSARPWESSLGLTLSETLYNNGTNLINYDLSGIQKSKAEIEFKKKRDRVCLDVIALYFEYSLAKLKADTVQEEYNILKEQYRLIEKKYKQGMKSRDDFIRFKTRMQRAEINLLSSRNRLVKYQSDIRSLIGVPFDARKDDTPEFRPYVPEKIDVSQIPEQKPEVSRVYDFVIADLDKKSNELDVRLAKRDYYPNVFVTSGIYYTASDYVGYSGPFRNRDVLYADALLNISFNLWDWGILRRKVSIAEETKNIENNRLDQSIMDLDSTLTKLMLELKRLKENYVLNTRLLELEKKNFDYLESEYRKGQIDYLSLINSLENLISAKNQYYESLFYLAGSLYEYSYYEGKIYEKVISD